MFISWCRRYNHKNKNKFNVLMKSIDFTINNWIQYQLHNK